MEGVLRDMPLSDLRGAIDCDSSLYTELVRHFDFFGVKYICSVRTTTIPDVHSAINN